jgi:hypothetical protein
MVRFLTTRGHEYTAKALAERTMEGASVPPCVVETYDRFMRRPEAPCGVYIFTDIERLTPWELRLASEAYALLAADPRCRVLNNPARVMSRYELLRNLHEERINEFDVIRGDERRWPSRFPVFLRNEQDHGRPLSLDLLRNRTELAAALDNARATGLSLRGLLIVGYAAEPFDAPWFRKFNTFRVGTEVFAHHVIIEDCWAVKNGKPGVKLPEEYKISEQQFVNENWNANLLRRVFDIAGIEYGRADWGLVGGKVQIYEINTNPQISGDPGTPNPIRRATLASSTRKLCDSLAALEKGTAKGTVKLEGKLLKEWRKGKRWYERPEWRP